MMSEQNMPERDPDYVCEDYGDVKAWTQIRVTVPLEQLDTLTALMSMISNNLMIEDYSDIETNLRTCYGDLIDEKILNADRTVASVSVYVPSDRSYTDDVAFLRDRMAADGLNGKLELVGVNEEDWANNWKQYYKPLKIGNRIVICPAWEAYTPTGNELVVRMDPGMASACLRTTHSPGAGCWTSGRAQAFSPSAHPDWVPAYAVPMTSTRPPCAWHGKTSGKAG